MGPLADQVDLLFCNYNGQARNPLTAPLSVNWAAKNAGAVVDGRYRGEEGGDDRRAHPDGIEQSIGAFFMPASINLPPFDSYDMKGRTYRYFTGKLLYPCAMA